MKKVKVFFITTELPSRVGGANVRNFNLLKHIDTTQVSVSLFTIVDTNTEKMLPSIARELAMPIYSVSAYALPFVSKLYYSVIGGVIPYMKEYELSGLATLLREHIEKEKPDIIHIEHLNAYYAISSVLSYAKERNISVVFDQHNVEQVAFSEGMHSMGWSKKILGYRLLPNLMAVEHEAITSVHHTFVCSVIDKQYFQKKTSRKNISIVPNGVDCSYFTHLPSGDKNTILFMGGTSYPPNNEGLLYYFRNIHAQVKKAIPDIKIYILGDTPPQWLRGLAKSDASIQLVGHVPDVRTYLEKATVCICPLISGSGTRLKILEYLASGKPVVSTSKGAEGINVTHEENILIADTPSEFAKSIITVCNNQGKAHRLGREGRKLITMRYQWAHSIKEIQQIYKKFV